MKKIIGILSVILVVILGGVIYIQANANVYEEGYYVSRQKEIHMDSAFEENAKVKELLEYINSLDQRNYGKKNIGNIYAGREGAVAEISISGIELPKYREQVEKIERVLEIEGLVEYIYGEEQTRYEEAALAKLSEGESINRYKQFGDVFVTVGQYRYEDSLKTVSIKILKDKLENPEYEVLLGEIQGDGYYLTNLIHGGEQEMFIFNNSAQLTRESRSSISIDEKGQILTQIPTMMRYEILTEEGKVQHVRSVARGIDKLYIDQRDRDMLLKSAKQLGLDESQVTHLTQIVEETFANPMKNRKTKIGEWEYQAKYTQRELRDLGREIYLDITLK